MTKVKWKWDSINKAYYFAYDDHLLNYTDTDGLYKGSFPYEIAKETTDNLFHLLFFLDVIAHVDTGNDGEPTVWSKK